MPVLSHKYSGVICMDRLNYQTNNSWGRKSNHAVYLRTNTEEYATGEAATRAFAYEQGGEKSY